MEHCIPTTLVSAEEELHWLALRLSPGLGASKARDLVDRFRTPQAIFRASVSELESAGLGEGVARSLSSGCSFDDAARQQEKAKALGAGIIAYNHPLYPPQLRELGDPPTILYYLGNPELLTRVCLAVVGTRRPSPYGIAATERLSHDLAELGLVIVSGMARGIDTAAHRATLQSGGATIAVFGCGVDLVYPAENRRLRDEIAERGLLVSEFPIGAPAYPQNFPIRNRIVSGLSAGVLVVEGAQYSGSAITARLAIEQGREVFAVPGNITSRASWGPNLLIKQGAHLIQEATDVVDALSTEYRIRLFRQAAPAPGSGATSETFDPAQASLPLPPSTELEAELLRLIPVDEPVHLDSLIETSQGATPSEVLAAMFEIELRGQVRQLPGKFFVKVWNV